MGRSISPMRERTVAGSDPRIAPRLIVPMSLQLVIPRRVALQQSSPPLHQPGAILREKRKFEKENPLNGKCANSGLSQQRGSPHTPVPNFVPTSKPDELPACTMRISVSHCMKVAYSTS